MEIPQTSVPPHLILKKCFFCLFFGFPFYHTLIPTLRSLEKQPQLWGEFDKHQGFVAHIRKLITKNNSHTLIKIEIFLKKTTAAATDISNKAKYESICDEMGSVV